MSTSAPVFLRADWHWLAMLNYAIEPAVLSPHVPPGTELDFFEGQTYVSVVGFRFLNTRVKGIPIPFHRNFDEVNLRFYVRHKSGDYSQGGDQSQGGDHSQLGGRDEWRRGVVFIKELVPKRAIAWVARTVYGENYHAVPMRHAIHDPRGDKGAGSVAYDWKMGERWHGLKAQIEGEPVLAAVGSEAQFITEHYWGYAGNAQRGTVEYEVKHPSWRLWEAKEAHLDLDPGAVYGPEFADALSGDPTSAFVAEGSEITVHNGRKL